ncbi:uncharacterized protein BO95DRAFT_149268 [Aspergillus brunneoviolaceus CBS 621.78]|uniref:Uncharacterized protein n=1 Tax=Aspergillus brunneoviolaceus CBS 621.78 TaxID=1450534 RepID=A0ACD1G7E2_9EURO|nr:hypothetical protein BO95DRAFT_149268 [Aspergillus brunneoviolaceus CBS 621.78]RAH45192.1 hypothetical protein BO95DRAFT_149268 [Aspergillus brunneoviolaceus CBS 621.78]
MSKKKKREGKEKRQAAKGNQALLKPSTISWTPISVVLLPACRSNRLGTSALLARSAGVSHRAYRSPHWVHTLCRWGRSEPQAFPCLEQAVSLRSRLTTAVPSKYHPLPSRYTGGGCHWPVSLFTSTARMQNGKTKEKKRSQDPAWRMVDDDETGSSTGSIDQPPRRVGVCIGRSTTVSAVPPGCLLGAEQEPHPPVSPAVPVDWTTHLLLDNLT